jgi:hypothetical protein
MRLVGEAEKDGYKLTYRNWAGKCDNGVTAG